MIKPEVQLLQKDHPWSISWQNQESARSHKNSEAPSVCRGWGQGEAAPEAAVPYASFCDSPVPFNKCLGGPPLY